MRNPRIEKNIPAAIDILQSEVAGGGTQISDVFKGYFASFGAAVVQSGLLPAVIFYGQQDNQAEGGKAHTGPQQARWKVTWCIYKLCFPQEARTVPRNQQHAALKTYCLKLARSNSLTPQKTQELLDAALALKMALRTFELVPDTQQQASP